MLHSSSASYQQLHIIIIINIITRFYCRRQGASADKLHVKADSYPLLDSPDPSKTQSTVGSYICAPVKSQYAVGALQKAHACHCILDSTCILSCQRPARGSFPTAFTCSSVADAILLLGSNSM